MYAEKNMESLEELVKCPICYDNFTKPRSLPCGHIFCLRCIQRQEESDPTKFIRTCCICRQEILPKRRASEFPPAFKVQQMVELMHDREREACDQGDIHGMVDLILNLSETRKQLKKDEESRVKQDIVTKKEEITKIVDEIAEKIKQYIDSQKQSFLESIDAECEKRLEKLNHYSQEAEHDCKVKLWVISNISDNFTMVTPPKPVLSVKATSLALESEGSHTVDVFLNSLDLNSIRRKFSESRHKNHSDRMETRGFSSSFDAQHARNDAPEENKDRTDHDGDTASRWESLRSVESQTSRVNIDIAEFLPDVTRSDLSDGNTLTSDSIQKDSNDVVSVTPYIVGNREVSRKSLEDRGANEPDHSPRENPVVFTEGDDGADAANSVSAVKIEHWEKASSHESPRSNAGDQLPGSPKQRGRISSAPTNGPESSEVTKPFVWRVRSNDLANERATGMWKSFRGPMVLRTTVVQDIAPSKRIYVHVTSNYTTLAVEEGTKMWVFMNAGPNGRRRFIFDAVAFGEREIQPAIIGIASLPNDNGWCMVLKNAILLFSYHGVLNLRRSFPDTNFLSALVHSSDKIVFIDKDFNIGIAGFSRDNVDEVMFLRPSGLKLKGVILAMATGPNMLFIAHADAERNVGTIACLSGLGSDSLVLSNDHEIHAPGGFDCPQSICCNQNGNLFALWRDKYHRKSVIVEYSVNDNVVISSIAFGRADRVRAITCSSEGRLVTCSV